MPFLTSLAGKLTIAGGTAVIAGAAAMTGFDCCPCDLFCDAPAAEASEKAAPGALAPAEPLPDMPSGDYDVDSVHSTALFRVQHAGAGLFWGRFNDVNGKVTYTPDKDEHFSFNIDIDLASVDSGNEKLDQHLKSPDFFNAKEFEKMTFKSTEVERLGQNVWDVTGDLTLNGITKKVIAVVRFTGTAELMGRRAGFEAEFDIKRSDFEHNYGIENGALGDKTRIIVGLEVVKAKEN